MIKAVIFDIGGVLAFDVWEHLLLDEKCGVVTLFNPSLDTQSTCKIGKKLWKKFAHKSCALNDLRGLEEEYWRDFIEELTTTKPELNSDLERHVNTFINRTDEFIRPVEGMVQLIAKLHTANVALAVCSNNTEFWFQRQFSKLGYADYFNGENIILSNRQGVSKSSEKFEMFQAVVDALGFDKTSCIFVDDRTENVERALQFGLPAILFPSHSAWGHKYLEALLDRLVPSGSECS